MAGQPVVRIFLNRFRTNKQRELLAMLNDKSVKLQVNEIIKDGMNEFVPMKTGALRASADVTPETISWGKGLKYGRYQYKGEVYGPNFPGAINGSPEWRSPKGQGSKYPTGREIGSFNGVLLLRPRWQKGEPKVTEPLPYKFGYTTPGTKHHWDRLFTYQPKMKANLEVTRLLKRECKKRGLKA